MARGSQGGVSNNPKGRPRGSKNRADAVLRAQFEMFLTYASQDIKDLFDKIKDDNPKQALDAIKDFAEFVLPKLQRTENQNLDKEGNPADAPDVKITAQVLGVLTEEQLKELENESKKLENNNC